ncbi:MAG: NADH-quinone oxidoreductase subunit N [Fidelibacterota bacterium]
MGNFESLVYFIPEFILTGTVLILILIDLMLKEKDSGKLAYFALVGLIGTFISLIIIYEKEPISLFNGMLALDPFSFFFKFLFLLTAFFVVLISTAVKELKKRKIGEYYYLILILTLGMFILSSATTLLTIYISIELVSITSYILAGYLKESRRSSEAALKYVIYGAFSSGIMLYGMSLLYGLTGSIHIAEINEKLLLYSSDKLTVILSILFILAGFGYKIASVPFHFWSPDVYEGAPTPFTAFLSVGPKAAGFAVIIRFFNIAMISSGNPNLTLWSSLEDINWPQILAAISAVTMTLGNLIAIKQNNLKRLFAYSSIAHAGYTLMGVVLLSRQGIFAVLFYLVAYYLMNLGAFFVVVTVANELETEDINAYTGLAYRAPFLSVSMAIFLFSLTGIPPTAGFIGKFYLFAALIKGGSEYYWLAIVGILNSVISLYYYARILKFMILRVPDIKAEVLKPSSLCMAVIGILIVPTIILGIYWAPLADFANFSINLLIGK